jgi:membrane protease YdiL (CAAX protease family)
MTLVRRFPVSCFLLATVVITYVLGVEAYLALKEFQASLGIDLPGVNDLMMKFGPTLGGILTIGLFAGRKGLGDLFRRCVRWQFPPLLYVGAILIQPAVLLAVLLARGYGAEARNVSLGAVIGAFASQLLLSVFLGGGLGEELGWRGFMLPRLCERYSPLVASLLVGIAWFAWHIPAYVLANKGESDPVLPFAVIAFPFSIILTWAYFRSKESLLPPILLHGAINASFYAMEDLLPGVTGAAGFQPGFDWTVAAIWCVIAGLIIAKYGPGLGREAICPEIDPFPGPKGLLAPDESLLPPE